MEHRRHEVTIVIIPCRTFTVLLTWLLFVNPPTIRDIYNKPAISGSGIVLAKIRPILMQALMQYFLGSKAVKKVDFGRMDAPHMTDIVESY